MRGTAKRIDPPKVRRKKVAPRIDSTISKREVDRLQTMFRATCEDDDDIGSETSLLKIPKALSTFESFVIKKPSVADDHCPLVVQEKEFGDGC